MLAVRIGRRKQAPQRVEGVSADTTIDALRHLALWAIGSTSPRSGPQTSTASSIKCFLIESRVYDCTDSSVLRLTLEECGVETGCLILAEVAETPEATPRKELPRTNVLRVNEADSMLLLGSFNEIGVHGETGDLWMGDRERRSLSLSSSLPLAVRLSPQRQRARESVHWVLNLSGDLFPAERAQTCFHISCDPEDGASTALLKSINQRLFGFRIWNAQVAPSREFVTLQFAMERKAAVWAHSRSPTLSQVPLDVIRRVMSYLSPCGELEVCKWTVILKEVWDVLKVVSGEGEVEFCKNAGI